MRSNLVVLRFTDSTQVQFPADPTFRLSPSIGLVSLFGATLIDDEALFRTRFPELLPNPQCNVASSNPA